MPDSTDRRPPRWLTADEAANVALAHGLTLADAVALRLLAGDLDEADRFAAMFQHKDAAA